MGSRAVARFGPFTLDNVRRQLTRDAGQVLHLTPRAFDLLALLIAEAPRVVPKAELHQHLWPGTFVSDATLAGLVKEVRRALDEGKAGAPLVRTAHRVGYAFCGALDGTAPAPDVWHWLVLNGRRIPLQNGENVIGREPGSAVWLDLAAVSRRHARIVIAGPSARVEDLGSKNGTRVGGLAVTGGRPLEEGDVVSVGPVVFVYRTSASGLSTETIGATAFRKR